MSFICNYITKQKGGETLYREVMGEMVVCHDDVSIAIANYDVTLRIKPIERFM